MKRISQRVALLCATAFLAALCCCAFDAAAQDKDKEKDKDKKVEKKSDDKDKKDEKDKKPADKDKKDDKDKKEEKKKEEFKPDPAQVELKGHKDWIYSVAFGSDGKTVASASRDRTYKVWDLGSKKDVQTIKGDGYIKAMAYLQDRLFTTGGKFDKKKQSWEGDIKVYDAKSGKELNKTLHGHAEQIECLALDKDGKTLYSGSKDQTVKVWDLDAGKDVSTIKAHTADVMAIALSKDGTKLATAGADGTVKVWDKSGKELAVFKVEKEVKTVDPKTKKETVAKEAARSFNCVAFSPDGKHVAAGNMDGYVKIWEVDAKKEQYDLKAHDGVWSVAYNPDGTQLATGGLDGTIKLWDAASGKDVRTIKAHFGTVTALAFSPDGTQLASGGTTDGMVKIWSVGKK
jgi:WD40 repeat protein